MLISIMTLMDYLGKVKRYREAQVGKKGHTTISLTNEAIDLRDKLLKRISDDLKMKVDFSMFIEATVRYCFFNLSGIGVKKKENKEGM